jgi:hypothetical protein
LRPRSWELKCTSRANDGHHFDTSGNKNAESSPRANS